MCEQSKSFYRGICAEKMRKITQEYVNYVIKLKRKREAKEMKLAELILRK